MKTATKTMPTKAQIADYWKDKTLPNGYPVIVDWYEPSCWACHDYQCPEEEGELIEQGAFNTLWNHPTYNLERCHIHPKALGGSNDVSNLFLMCPTCHKDSPDTTNRELFFEWVSKRTLKDTLKSAYPWIYDLANELENRNIPVEDFNSWYEEDKTRYEKAYEQMNSHGFEIVDSTIVAGFLGYYLENVK